MTVQTVHESIEVLVVIRVRIAWSVYKQSADAMVRVLSWWCMVVVVGGRLEIEMEHGHNGGGGVRINGM